MSDAGIDVWLVVCVELVLGSREIFKSLFGHCGGFFVVLLLDVCVDWDTLAVGDRLADRLASIWASIRINFIPVAYIWEVDQPRMNIVAYTNQCEGLDSSTE